MRVTNTLFYSTSVTEHQNAMKKLYDIDKQIASGMKIQNSFENSGVYVDTMRLNYEIATLEQTKESSSKAQTFALNTDSTLNQMEKALEQFKTKLIQANNSTNSSTSLNAIADELEGLKKHLISLGNTSINGQFLFSGSSLLQKSLASDGTYMGNNESLNAIVGSGVELPYNISGASLFLGSDSDYNRIVSTNISMYNQSKLHPDVMVINSGVTASQKVFLTAEDTIRDMVGDTDNIATTDLSAIKDPSAVFHISGRRPDGTTFNTSIEMQSYEKVSVLLEKIGQSFGNTPTNRVVDVAMNDHGQIEIKDLKPGNQLLEMHIVGAVDRSALSGSEGAADKSNLIAENVQIVEFIKSDFKSANTSSSISSRQDIFSPGQFTLGAPMFKSSGEYVDTSTKLRSFMGDEINQIQFSGKNNSGTTINPIPPLDVLRIDNNTTVQQLLSAVESAYGVSARLEDGQIYLNVGSNADFSANKLHVKLDASKYAGDGEVQSLEITSDSTSSDNFSVAGYNVTINHPKTAQEIAALIAAEESNIMALPANANIASIRADGHKVYIDYKQSAGSVPDVVIVPNGTGISSVIQEVAPYVTPGLSEVQMFEITENPNPSIDGTINIGTISIAFGPSSTPLLITADDIAAEIENQEAAIITANPSISSITSDGAKVTVTYNSTAGNVTTLSPTISQDVAGVDDLTITHLNERTITQGSGTLAVNAFTTFDTLNLNNFNFTKEGNTLQGNVSQMIKQTNTYATEATKLSEVAGISSLHERVLDFDFINRSGVQSHGKINLQETSPYSTFQIDVDNSGTYEDNETISLYNGQGTGTKASEVTYKQVMDVLSIALSGAQPNEKVSTQKADAINDAIAIYSDPASTPAQKTAAMDRAKESMSEEIKTHIENAINYGVTKKTSTDPVVVSDAHARYLEALKNADLQQYGELISTAHNSVDISLDYRGQMLVKDKLNTNTPMQLSIKEHHAYALNDVSSSLSFMANDAIKIQNPSIDFFKNLDSMIDSVRKGEFQLSADNKNPRNLGINYALSQLDHILDHVTKEHTKIGAYSNALGDANERAEYLSLNVKTVRSSVIDVDAAEAYLQFNQISNSYQAMLSTIAKINSMSLLNYM